MQLEFSNSSPSPSSPKHIRISQSTAAGDPFSPLFQDPQPLLSQVNLKTAPNFDLLRTRAVENNLSEEAVRKLVDWMVGCCWRFDLDEESIVLTLTLLRVVLRNKNVQKNKVQSVGLCCMFVAAKYCGVVGLGVEDVMSAGNGTSSVEEILEGEEEILRIVDFSLNIPTLHGYYSEYAGENVFLYGEQYYKFFFWVEVWMLGGLLEEVEDKQLFVEIMTFVLNPGVRSPIVEKLVKFVETTEHRYVMKRCLSFFDLDSYLSEIRLL